MKAVWKVPKLIWKGAMNDRNRFVCDDLPPDAKKLFPEHGQWKMYLLILPILLMAYLAIIIRSTYAPGMMFSRVSLLIGVVLSLPFIAVHELIHAFCCPGGTIVYMYTVPLGLCMIPTQPLRKGRYLFMVLMPAVILGIIPFALWLCVPALSTAAGSILFGFALGSLSMSIGDIYNAILAMVKMTPDSLLITSGNDCYYFEG